MRFNHSLKYALLYRLFLFWEDFDLAGRYWISFQICYRRRCLVDYYQKFTNTRISGKTFAYILSIISFPYKNIKWIILNYSLTKVFCISRKLLVQCDSEGFLHNCLVPLRHYLPSPGGPLKYSLEGHRFAIFSCCVSTDKRYVVSVSNK